MGFPVMLPLRGVQAVFNIIELGLVAYAVHQYTRTYCLYDSIYSNSRSCGAGSSPSELSFLLFNTIWTMLAIVYLTLSVTVLPKFGHKIAILVVDAVTMIFWFAGFIAMAVIVGEADRLTGSYTSRSTLRQVTRATVAFAAFLWALFVVSTVFSALAVFRKGGTNPHTGHSSSKPAGGPAVHSGV